MTHVEETRGQRALAPRTLLWQLVVVVCAEAAIYWAYARHDSHFHFTTHLLVGLTAASLWRSVFLLVARRPSRFQLLSIVGFHLWAMWPDLAFRIGLPHYRWMDWVALGHISSHYVPGGDRTWLVIALLATGGYAGLLSHWLARHRPATVWRRDPAEGHGRPNTTT